MAETGITGIAKQGMRKKERSDDFIKDIKERSFYVP